MWVAKRLGVGHKTKYEEVLVPPPRQKRVRGPGTTTGKTPEDIFVTDVGSHLGDAKLRGKDIEGGTDITLRKVHPWLSILRNIEVTRRNPGMYQP